MTFLRDECEQRGACVVYATHIFDGLESWPTHVAYVARGKLQMVKRVREKCDMTTDMTQTHTHTYTHIHFLAAYM